MMAIPSHLIREKSKKDKEIEKTQEKLGNLLAGKILLSLLIFL